MNPTILNSAVLLSPELLVIITAFLVLAVDLFGRNAHKTVYGCSLLGLFSALAASLMLQLHPVVHQVQTHEYIASVMAIDTLALYLKSVILFLTLGSVALSYKAFDDESRHPGEYYCLILLATLGQLVAVSSHELLTFFVSFELLSLPLYMLAGFRRYESASAEAGIKYFLTGALSSAIMLFGMSWVYGNLGTTEFAQIATRMSELQAPPHSLLVGFVMIAIGLCFKVSAAPFHNWAPDVYSGAPGVVVTYLSTAPKAAMVGVLLRLFWQHLNITSPTFSYGADWKFIFVLLSVLSMFIGNLSALPQVDVKRLLAYSGVAQIGYLFLGLAACSKEETGAAATLFFITAYTLSNFLAWAAVFLACQSAPDCHVERFNGLAKRSPLIALALLMGFMSLAGVPPLFGFVGKFALFRAIYQAGFPFLVVFGILNSVISLYYYFKVLRAAYFGDTVAAPIVLTWPQQLTLQSCLVLVISLGLWPGLLEHCFWVARMVIK